MENIQTVFVANGAACTLLVILVFSIQRNLHTYMIDDKLFRIMIGCTFFQAVFETLSFYFDKINIPTVRELCVIINVLLYIASLTFSFIWVLFADYKLFGDVKRFKTVYPLVAIPTIVTILCSLANLFVPVFFMISIDNVYTRTNYFWIPFMVSFCNLIYGVVIIYKYRKKVNKYLFLPALIFMLPILLSSILQFVFYGLSLFWLGTAIALVSLYVNVQNEVSYIDNLTGLFTRDYLKQYIYGHKKDLKDNDLLVGVMLDIDRFKNINDTYGHLVGDEAIMKAGHLLLKNVPSSGMGFRFAGDEFVIIFQTTDLKEVEVLFKNLDESTSTFNKAQQNSYQITFSKGYAVYDYHKDSFDEFVGRMDKKMYENKRYKNDKHLLPERRNEQNNR